MKVERGAGKKPDSLSAFKKKFSPDLITAPRGFATAV